MKSKTLLSACAVALVLMACDSSQNAPSAQTAQEPAPSQPAAAATSDATPPAAALQSDKQKFSYTIGYQLGQSVMRDSLDVDGPALVRAVQDSLGGKPPQLSTDEMKAAVIAYRQKLIDERNATAQVNKKTGDEFLAANKTKEGVVTLPSGLQYRVIKEGNGKTPGPEDTVVVNYRGTLIDGTEFDSSYKRGEPTTLQVNKIIPGWKEALQLMKQGANWQLVVPPDLAYGERGAGNAIGPNETLIFDVDLVEVK